jgi:hypothetical protein
VRVTPPPGQKEVALAEIVGIAASTVTVVVADIAEQPWSSVVVTV